VLEIADALQASASVHMKYNKMTIHNRKFSFLIRVYKSDVSEQITSVICGFAAFSRFCLVHFGLLAGCHIVILRKK